MAHAGHTGNDPEHVGTQTLSGRSHVILIGPSCSGMDHLGRLIWGADNDRKVTRLEKDGTHTVLFGGMNGQKADKAGSSYLWTISRPHFRYASEISFNFAILGLILEIWWSMDSATRRFV